MNDSEILDAARNLIRAEGAAIAQVAEQLDQRFTEAARLLASCQGKILLTGAGTSGAIAYRIAHLMATCSLPAFYIPPGDALHGESALLAPGDILLALSKAGKSSDINQFASIASQRGATIICLTANPDSELAQLSDLVLVVQTDAEAEGDGVLPFGSTLAHGAFGDALTLMAKQIRGFDLNTLTHTHPLGGANELLRQKKDN